MIEAEIDYEELENLIAKIAESDKVIDRIIKRDGPLMLQLLLSIAKKLTHEKELVNTGAYLSGLQVSRFVGGVGMGYRGMVMPTAGHSWYVERGRNPGKWPPEEAIELWVRRKLGLSDDQEVKSVTFLVRRAIGEMGTIKRFGYKGGEIIKETVTQGRRQVEQVWEKTVSDIANELRRYLTS
jgi:hypothetical protein